jgi:ribosomal protein S18 acetylase RimI-like enzyme
MEVRAARAADLESARRVVTAAYDQFRPVIGADLYSVYLDDLVDFDGRSSVAELLVADRGGEIAGAVTYYPAAVDEGFGWPEDWAGFRALAVDPAQRGHGVGERLVSACVERATAAGSPVLCLHTASFMDAAVRLYERLGFERRPEFDTRGGELIDVGGRETPTIIAYSVPLG